MTNPEQTCAKIYSGLSKKEVKPTIEHYFLNHQ